MSVNYNIAVLNSRLRDVVSAIDAGPSNGFLRLLLVGGTVASSFQLSRPCATVTGGVLTFSGMSLIDPSAAATGTAAGARFETSDGTVVISGLVINQDITLSPSAFITAGQTVAITAATITGN